MRERPRRGSFRAAGRRLSLLLTMLACLQGGPLRAEANQPLIVDLSNHLVAITTGFAGATVLLFGAVEGEGDLVVVVRGPPQTEVVRRREPVLGIWVNRAQALVSDMPAYYRVASSGPLDQVAAPAVLDRYQIGVDHLKAKLRRRDKAASDADYIKAVLRLKEGSGLYQRRTATVSFVGGRLFRTEMEFPANVPTGIYSVEVYLLRQGQVASAQSTPLMVSKTGLGAEVFDFANSHAALYGLGAILLAASAGWLGAVAFRRG